MEFFIIIAIGLIVIVAFLITFINPKPLKKFDITSKFNANDDINSCEPIDKRYHTLQQAEIDNTYLSGKIGKDDK